MQKQLDRVVLLFFTAITAFAVIRGAGVSGEVQLEIYKTLLAIASIVFAIMGAWLSILKIEIINGVKNAETDEEGNSYVDKARNLVNPMTSSALIIILCLIYTFTYLSLNDLGLRDLHIQQARGVSFVILNTLVFFQMFSLVKLLFSGVDFVIDISRLNKDVSGDRNR